MPDEAYSLKVDLVGDATTANFFPANVIREPLDSRGVYDRFSGVVSYKLPAPARVHMQAGSARLNPKTNRPEGPVLKTIVNREPRAGGAIVESWNGWDESGTVRVCDLQDFSIAIAATPLPDQSVITVGNRKFSYFDWVAKRTGTSLLTIAPTDHSHHRGLQALDDVAPALQLKPRNADWSASESLWLTKDGFIEVEVSVEGPTAAAFSAHPGKIMVFLDLQNIKTLPPEAGPIAVPLRDLAAGPHRLTVDWVSDYGPVAVNTVLFRTQSSQETRTVAR